MNFLKRIYYNAASLLPISAFLNGGPNRILLPYHHLVNNKKSPHVFHLYPYKDELAFRQDLEWLIKHYRPIHPDELYAHISKGIEIPKGTFLLTFDDGFKEVYDIIAPILKQYGIPAIFFINPAFIDNKELFYRSKISLLIGELKKSPELLSIYAAILQVQKNENVVLKSLKEVNNTNTGVLDNIAEKIHYSFENFLRQVQPVLNRAQIIDLHQQGFTIGAHSVNHPYYHLLSEDEQIKQTIDSCNYVKEITGQNVCHFSFPHSDVRISKKVIDQINSNNQGLLFGIQNQKQELHNNILHRFNAERPGMAFEKLIKGQLLMNMIQKIAGKNIVKRT